MRLRSTFKTLVTKNMKFLVSEERAWWIKTLNEFKFHNNLHLDFIFVLGNFCPFFIDFHHQYYNNYNFTNILSGIWVHKHLFFDEALWVHVSIWQIIIYLKSKFLCNFFIYKYYYVLIFMNTILSFNIKSG